MAGNSNTPMECDNMDELYIRMCQGAREIRDTRKPKWANLKPGFEDFEVVNDNEGNRWYIETTSMEGYVLYTWLPRIEDLQEIFRLKNGNPDEYWILKSFLVWFSYLNFCHTRDVSIIQLWLRYVMETVYKKRWNGTEWEPLP